MALRTGRLVPLLGLALGLVYGAAIEKMPFSPPLVMVGLGGMTLALCGVALWRIIDPLLRPEAPAGAPGAGSSLTPNRLREVEREKQAVLKAIKELEFDYQMRKVAESDYREMTERYRRRAIRLLGEIDAGDDYRQLIERELKDRLAALDAAPATSSPNPPESPPPPVPWGRPGGGGRVPSSPSPLGEAGRGCKSCGSPNDADADFCKKCGARIER